MDSCQNILGKVFYQQHVVDYGVCVQDEDTQTPLKDMPVLVKPEQLVCGMFKFKKKKKFILTTSRIKID